MLRTISTRRNFSVRKTYGCYKRSRERKMKCVKCGKEMVTYLFCSTGTICDTCYLKENPPKMRLVFIENAVGRPLYNITHKSYEDGMAIEHFERCGWFLRKKKETNGFTFYYLEFYGNIRCGRFPEVHFPFGYRKCTKYMLCRNSMAHGTYSGNYLG